MSGLLKTEASLRFFGDALIPDEVTRLLGSAPTHADVKGQPVKYPPRSTRIAKTGSWRLHAAPRTPGNLDAQITEIFSKLVADLSIWKRLTRAYKADLFCGLYMGSANDGESLSVESLTLLAERGIVIGFDIYEGDRDGDSDRH